jgi:hypothetical protein
LELTGAASNCCWKRGGKTFCPISRIGPVNARLHPSDKYPVNNLHLSRFM